MSRFLTNSSRGSGVCFLLVGILSLSGCNGRGYEAATYPTSGSILINGAAPVGLLVYFRPMEKPVDNGDSIPWAIVKEDGNFRVTTYYEFADGCPPGEFAVTLYWPDEKDGLNPKDRLKDRFRSLESPAATVMIERGENILPQIALNGVELLPAK